MGNRTEKLFTVLFHKSLTLVCSLVLLMLFLGQEHPLLVLAGSAVKFLPGFDGPLPFELETGYIGVDEAEDTQLFYYFVKSQSNPQVDPLVIWMTGGPGCTSLTAFLYEIGPLTFEEELDNGILPRLVSNPNSWTEVASIIFLDVPVETGFSYARTSKAINSTGLQTCHQVDQFLRKFLDDHPDFMSNPFYVAGDSFSGIFVPVVAHFISQGNENGMLPFINMKGYILGNPVTTPADDNYHVPFAHGMGIISDELYEALERNCKGVYVDIDPSNKQCVHDHEMFKQLLDGIQDAHVLEPSCGFYAPNPQNQLDERRSLKEKLRKIEMLDLLRSFWCRVDGYKLVAQWANDESVQEALHIQKGSIKTWIRCNYSLPFTNSIRDCVPYHANLSRKGYRSLIYSGDHDFIVPFLATQAWIRSLNYSIIDDWRQWIVEGQVAGYTRTYANKMTFATVKARQEITFSRSPLLYIKTTLGV